MTQGPNQGDITTREGFAAEAAPLERLLLSVSFGVLRSWDLAADAAQNALLRGYVDTGTGTEGRSPVRSAQG